METRLRKSELPTVPGHRPIDQVVAEFEKEYILNILEQNRYNLSRTAEQLQISRHALRYRMQRLNINTGSDADEEAAPSSTKEATQC